MQHRIAVTATVSGHRPQSAVDLDRQCADAADRGGARQRQRKAQPRSIQVELLIGSALQLLAYGLRSAGIKIEQMIASGLPPVFCDPDQMTQVLTNLLVNAHQALKAEPQPRRVRVSAAADGDFVAVEIADNGPGIPDNLRSRIFDPAPVSGLQFRAASSRPMAVP